MHRETFVHRHLYTQRFFLQRRKFLHTDAVREDAFAGHRQRHVGSFTHRTLPTEKPLHRTIVLDIFFAQKEIDTEKIVHTDCAKKNTPKICTQKLYPELFLHRRNSSAQKPLRTDLFKSTAIITDRWFLHRKFSVQKSYAQTV